MENYYVRILTKNMRNVYVEAHRRAMKEYYPPHLTGPGSRGVGPLDIMLFALNLTWPYAISSVTRAAAVTRCLRVDVTLVWFVKVERWKVGNVRSVWSLICCHVAWNLRQGLQLIIPAD